MRRPVLIALAAAALVGGVLMLASFARDMVYPAPPVAVPSPPPAPLAEVWLELEGGGSVSAWAREPPGIAPEAPVALFFHGNGENLETMRRAGLFEELDGIGAVVLAADYPGYGRSPGRPREAAILATGDAALAWARRRHPERPVVLAGWSLGAAVALDVASRHPDEVSGLVAMSAWTTLEDVAAVHFSRTLARWALPERYDSLAAARRLAGRRLPALLVHGERDTIVPVALGRRLAEALEASGAAEVRWLPIRGASHNDLLAHDEVWRELERFVDGLSRRQSR
ncbi:MAG TPA: alpha/beta fold hydrolase [Thermoanaerobaculia bacterium]|nr:alpha/beta fold hydrolase [Thermoanaerobaculia bacterium]